MALEHEQGDEFTFLGEEFLVWLWWQAETRGGVYAVGDDERIGVALDSILEFYDEATEVRVVVRGDAPTRAPEAREALSRGMRLTRAGLIVTVSDENVSVVLDGPSLDLRSVKAEKPQGDTAEDRDGAALASIFGLTDAVDRVYRRFLVERVSSRFNAEVAPELLGWARRAADGHRGVREPRERVPEATAGEAAAG